jgi:ribonucleoside-diphosphate reductase beta chain
VTPPVRDRFQTTSERGLDRDLLPMRLFAKSKRHGVWNPEDLDFTRDREDWNRFSEEQKDAFLRLTSLFQAGEESVTLDLLPLIQTLADEGRLEEEMYLAAFLWEEAKHVDLFRRFLDEVARETGDLSRYHSPSYRTLFYQELPRALGRLREEPSPEAQAEASVTYNLIVEGVLAESGYHGYHQILERNDLMPGMLEAVRNLQRDESRHLAYGVFLLCRLVAEHGVALWNAVERRMGELLTPALGVIHETFEPYDVMPFGLRLEDFTDFAMTRFQRRLARIEKARHQSLEEILYGAAED